MWIFISLSIILGVIALLISRGLLRDRKYKRFLLNNSIALKRLFEINSKYEFYNVANCNEVHTYDNEIFYNNISCEDYLIYQLQFKKSIVENQISRVNINKNNYFLYCQEISNIDKVGKYTNLHKSLNRKKLLSYEIKLFKKNTIKPTTQFVICVRLYCSKINGSIYRSKYQEFYSEHILNLIKRLNNKNGNFYNDKDIWESLCRVERGRVSNKMRFAIYKRDGYRCQICGKGQYFSDLEIDHIKPIAKGGKSVYSNLQTLCSRCNKNKGDDY